MTEEVTAKAGSPAQSAAAQGALLHIEQLVLFGLANDMIAPLDVCFARNALLDLFRFTEPLESGLPGEAPVNPLEALEALLDYGAEIGLIPDNTTTWRDLLDARIMGLIMPRPSEAAERFHRTARTEGMQSATDAFYKLNIDSNYIRMDRIRKNVVWQHETEYGNLDMTINLSKPEKDPKEIALLKTMPQGRYPKCLLCADNVGYAGRADHPARQNLRVLPLKLRNEPWYFQYSPYVYYNEHSIVFAGRHTPMKISGATFERLLDFVEQFPHYFIGSNADLPIVGGSILNHDHFQAGRHTFAMETASREVSFTSPSLSGVTFSIVKWPMSVIRLDSTSKEQLLAAAELVFDAWRGYSDPEAGILASSQTRDGAVPHNTVTPIARLRDNGTYELDLVLRNNRTSEEHPDGIFHPHRHLHHIKKENIGLIEVMGLAVLPGRLKSELEQIARILTGETKADAADFRDEGNPLRSHAAWIEELTARFGTAMASEEAESVLKDEVGKKFQNVLENAGVYKRTEDGQAAFRRFLTAIGLTEKRR
ncbi:UDP-glucose--hexose-1-phosphate uridylyltransferase [Paenibacillus tarimensis]